LCPDGSCIGIIGADGRCNECGASATGGRESGAEQPLPSDAMADDHEPELPPEEDAGSSPDFDPKRRLCSDGACIGVIGGDNRCTLCGRPTDD